MLDLTFSSFGVYLYNSDYCIRFSVYSDTKKILKRSFYFNQEQIDVLPINEFTQLLLNLSPNVGQLSEFEKLVKAYLIKMDFYEGKELRERMKAYIDKINGV